MSLKRFIFTGRKAREERRERYWRIYEALQDLEQNRIQGRYYDFKRAEALTNYCVCLVERMEAERPEALREAVEALENIVPPMIAHFKRTYSEANSDMYSAEGRRQYTLELLAFINWQQAERLPEALQRIETAAGAELVRKERFYLWVESGAPTRPEIRGELVTE